MRKLVLSATLLLSVATFAQKEELKTLKKLYAKETISEKDVEIYKTTSSALQAMTLEEADKVYADFYKGMIPIVQLTALGAKVTSADQVRLMSENSIDDFSKAVIATLAYEKKNR